MKRWHTGIFPKFSRNRALRDEERLAIILHNAISMRARMIGKKLEFIERNGFDVTAGII